MYSGISESYYLPSHLLSKVQPQRSENEALILANTLKFSLTHIHEWNHWFQHIGTTVGLFLEFVRHSQSALFMKWIKEQPVAIRSNIFDGRFTKNKPLVQLDRSGAPIAAAGSPNDPINFVVQAWYDHQFLHEFISDSTMADRYGMIGAPGFSNVMADVALFTCDDMGFRSSEYERAGHMGARRWFFAQDQRFPLVKVNGRRITTKSLMECAATISEISYIQGHPLFLADESPNSAKVVSDVKKKLLQTQYGHPIEGFSKFVTGSTFADSASIYSTLSATIFAALNPPLPPVFVGPKANGESWSWDEIYPPIRYLKLCRAVNSVGPLNTNAESSEIEAYIGALIEASGVPYCAFSELPSRKCAPPRSVAKAVEIYSSGALSVGSINIHQELPLEAFTELQRHDRKYELSVTLGKCFNGRRATEFASMAFDSKLPFDLLKPPLLHTPEGRIGYHGSKDFGTFVCTSVILTNGYYDLACGTGNIDVSMFPEEDGIQGTDWSEILKANVRKFWELETF